MRRRFIDATDALEFRVLITRRVQRFRAGLELIPERVTFGDWVDKWIETRKKIRPESTWSGEVTKLEKVWLPKFRDIPLQAIHSTAIAEVLQKLLNSGLSPATRNRHRALILRIFSEARFAQPPLVMTNPVSAIRALPEPWKHREFKGLKDLQEMSRYCATSWQFGLGWGLIATILVWSGIRIGEALALRWMDVEGDQIVVRRIRCSTTNRIYNRTKGQREGGKYYALLLPPVRRALDKVRRARGEVSMSELICGSPAMGYWNAEGLHRYTRHRAGGLLKFPMHGLRHSFSRHLKRAGFTRDEIRDVIGHESTQTVERYTRTNIAHVVKKAKRKKLGK